MFETNVEKRLSASYYPYVKHLHNLFKDLGSPQTGIIRSLMLTQLDAFMPNIFSIAGDIADIHKLIGIQEDIQYHVGGYGLFYEEALIKVMSEALERYSIMLYPYLVGDRITYATYDDLQRHGEDLPPFEYYQLFSDFDYQREGFPFVKPSPDQVVGWIPGHSIFNGNRELLVPAQVVLPGYKVNSAKGEKQWAPGFSTGAASNISYESALLSAITEIIEIDAFNINWFTERRVPRISFEGTMMEEIINKTIDVSILEPVMLYHRLPDINIHTMSTFIINKKKVLPAVSAGAQCSLDPIHCAYRSFAEATAVTLLGMSGYVYQPMLFLGDKDYTKIRDLDSNVAFYGEPRNYELSTDIINKLTASETIHLDKLAKLTHANKKDDLLHLVKELSNISKHAVAINVTTPDVASKGFRIVKAYIPELMYMSLPSYPFTNHPRMRKYGGVKNEYPHPLP